jgi:hypothetical protein
MRNVPLIPELQASLGHRVLSLSQARRAEMPSTTVRWGLPPERGSAA